LVTLLTACSSHQAVKLSVQNDESKTVSLNGTWDFYPQEKQPTGRSWKTIQVPANWYKQNYDIHGKAWYRKRFHAASNLKGKKVNLSFKGADYITDVWINGKHLGTHEGYFQHFHFDLTKHLKLNASNTLMVRVDSPLEKPADFSLRKRLIKGIFSHHDTRPGGAWSKRGQERNTGGLWNSVELHISENVFIEQVKAIPEKLNNDTWRLKTDLINIPDLPKGAEVQWVLSAKNHTAAEQRGNSTKSSFNINVNKPALWWPIGYGQPNLYDLKVQVMDQGKVLDSKHATVAFRNVELDKNKVWRINGQRILLRGTNYIATQWLSEMNTEKFDKDIQLMLDAHINTVRVHAHITAPEFYRLCDEKGLMIWQDFPLQWGYQDTEEFHQQAKLQLKDMLVQLANHPSIIHWTIHNEPPWDADWMKWKYKDYDPKQNEKLDKELLVEAEQLEQSRPISKQSATSEHPWLGWYSGHWLDYAKPAKTPFIAEFGAQALPNMVTLKKIMGSDLALPEKSKDWKTWEKWKYHNFQPRETFEVAKVKPGRNAADLIRNTQRYQSRLTQLAAESYRRQAYKPVTALFQFMFVEDWESMNWGIVDYWRNTKPGYESLKMAYQPLLPSLEWSKVEYSPGKVEVGLWIVNDSVKHYSGLTYQLELFQGDQRLERVSFNVDVGADVRKKIKNYQSPELKTGAYAMRVRLLDKQNKVLAYNRYQFSVASNKNNNNKKED